MPRIANEAEIALAEDTYHNRPTGKDDTLWVHFYNGACLDPKRSAEQKRAIFYDAVKVQIQVPGDNTLAIDTEAIIDEENEHNLEAHNNRFPKQWEQFKKGLEQNGDGTPITALMALPASQREELKHAKVRTIEQLATLSDANCQRLGPGYTKARETARAFVAAQRDAAPLAAVKGELASRDAKIAELQAQMAELMKGKSPKKAKSSSIIVQEETARKLRSRKVLQAG